MAGQHTEDSAFRRIFVASRTPMALADATTLRFVDANEAYCEMVGYSRAELLDRTPLNLTVPEDGAREAALFQSVVASERYAYNLEKRFVHKSGTIVWCSVSVTVLLDDAGSPELGVAICEDISERKRGEEERRRFDKEMLQAQKLESLGLLAGGIAHDFNNLLVGIIGNAELAHPRIEDQTARQLLDDLLESANVASDLCRQMLAYSGGGIIERRPINLAELVTSSLRLFDASRRGRVRLVPPEERTFTVADVVQLRQLVLNLLTNAHEALAQSDGEVRVSLRAAGREAIEGARVVVDGEHGGRWVWLEVSDDGAGMDAATLGRAFEPFRSTKGQGRGLGLAAVTGIVRAHGGVLAVRSAPGEGSTFSVGMKPAAFPSGTDAPAQAPPRTDPPAGPRRVLLVDDDAMVRRVVARVLQTQAHEVVELDSLADALAALSRGAEFDIVVTDLTMPDGSGLELARRAHEEGIPVVVITGYSEASARPEQLATISAFLRKPFRPADLLDAVAKVLA